MYPKAPPSQIEVIHLISQLHNADIISSDTQPNYIEVDRRAREEKRKTIIGYFKNPLSLRIPLFDPNNLLNKLSPVERILFSKLGGIVWVSLLISALVAAFLARSELEAPGVEALISSVNLIYVSLSYIFVKLLHEIGHGLAIKRWGGEVREVGVMLLIFFPVPYVDASQATFFERKYQRMVVSGAGVMVETAIASVAFLVWINAEPGPISTFSYNLFLIGGISTLLFNGNPLLRFDGYFVFSDMFELPNLAQRANQYFLYTVQKYVLGNKDAQRPVASVGEEPWLFTYSIAAFIYRLFVMVFISIYVATVVPLIGVAIVAWSIYMTFLSPILKGLRFLLLNPSLDVVRSKSLLRVIGVLVFLAIALFYAPLPYTTVADGVLEGDEDAIIRVAEPGVVQRILVSNGSHVEAGDPIIQLEDPLLEREIALAKAELREAQLHRDLAALEEATARSAWSQQVDYLSSRLRDFEQRRLALSVRAPMSGTLIVPEERTLVGRLLGQGETVGFVQFEMPLIWHTAIPAARSELVDTDLQSVSLRPYIDIESELPAKVIFRAPEYTTQLESFALTERAGGHLVSNQDATNPASVSPIRAYSIASVQVPNEFSLLPEGARAKIRFVHSPTPLAPRIWRAIRQTFLTFFNV